MNTMFTTSTDEKDFGTQVNDALFTASDLMRLETEGGVSFISNDDGCSLCTYTCKSTSGSN